MEKSKYVLLVLALSVFVIFLVSSQTFAAVTYKVTIFELDRQGGERLGTIDGATVKMNFWDGQSWTGWMVATELPGGGTYKVQRASSEDTWQIWMTAPELDPAIEEDNPTTRAGSVTETEWEFLEEE